MVEVDETSISVGGVSPETTLTLKQQNTMNSLNYHNCLIDNAVNIMQMDFK